MTAGEEVGRTLRKLVAEIEADLAAFESLAAEVAAFDARMTAGDDPALRAAVALTIEHAYTGIESAFHRIARVVDGASPEGVGWHRQLLKDMALSVEGVRPAVVGPETAEVLRRLLGFRHFLRHAYAVALDTGKLHDRARDVAVAAAGVRRDLPAFAGFLRRTAEEARR